MVGPLGFVMTIGLISEKMPMMSKTIQLSLGFISISSDLLNDLIN